MESNGVFLWLGTDSIWSNCLSNSGLLESQPVVEGTVQMPQALPGLGYDCLSRKPVLGFPLKMLPDVLYKPPCAALNLCHVCCLDPGKKSSVLSVSPPQRKCRVPWGHPSVSLPPSPEPSAHYRSTCICETQIFWEVVNNNFSGFIDPELSISVLFTCDNMSPRCPHNMAWDHCGFTPGNCMNRQQKGGPAEPQESMWDLRVSNTSAPSLAAGLELHVLAYGTACAYSLRQPQDRGLTSVSHGCCWCWLFPC